MSGAATARGARPPVRRAAIALAVAGTILLTAAIPLAAALDRAESTARLRGLAHPVAPSASPASFSVNMTDAPAFSPSTLTGAAGQPVSVLLRDTGEYNHTFTLESKPVALDPKWSPAQLDAFFRANGSLANLNLTPGASGWANFTIPANATGKSLEFVSLVPYQFQAGMYGYLNVSAGGPSFFLSDNTTNALSFVPNVLYVPATSYPVVVQVTVTNLGSLSHTWTLSALPGLTLSPSNFTTFFLAHPPLGSGNVPASPGGSVTVNVTLPAQGVYDYICEIPGHFAAGMNGTLWAGIPPPPPAVPPSTAIVQGVILATAGILLAIATLLAFATNYIGRFRISNEPPHH